MNDIPRAPFGESSTPWRGRGLPVVYSCSGCSRSGQLAHHIAIQLDRRGLARMSCIAALTADVPQIVLDLRSAPQVIALDGCNFHCARKCIERYGVTPRHHYVIVADGIAHDGLDQEAERFIERVLADLLERVQRAS